MKTIMKSNIWIFFIAVTMMSCSKGEDCDPNDEQSPCYSGIVQGNQLLLVEEKVNGVTDISFLYNEENQITTYRIHPKDGVGESTAVFTYNDKGNMISATHSHAGKHVYREDYAYGTDDKPVSGTWTYPHGVVNLHFEYTNNMVLEKISALNGQGYALNKYTFDSKGENLLRTELNTDGTLLSIMEFSDFDDKNYRMTGFPWKWKTYSINNAKSQKLTGAGVAGTSIFLDHIWKYTYNDSGYPTKAEIYDRATNKLVETREYIYKKAN
ncbi:hypothetical protein [Sphingobacterium sp. CZ-2]|uniref:hypothetical protein n=1 Tax=Sphingobacterium sp. CZ-2 TaxID=2557994 RepID=UPI0010700FB5|nr:hypothetical protein [Sphingobacterium sp. CZ-2]QBR13429.1 hypothetical protein E3D81_15105 [Sphingobacterium sp. CZ-2]